MDSKIGGNASYGKGSYCSWIRAHPLVANNPHLVLQEMYNIIKGGPNYIEANVKPILDMGDYGHPLVGVFTLAQSAIAMGEIEKKSRFDVASDLMKMLEDTVIRN